MSRKLTTNEIQNLIPQNEIQIAYQDRVNHLIRQKYSADQVEAIINNYLSDMSNVKHKKEFDDLQEFRKECKQRAKKELGLESE